MAKRRRKRGRRKPKPLYERSGTKYFGKGFHIDLNAVRQIAKAVQGRWFAIPEKTRELISEDLANAFFHLQGVGKMEVVSVFLDISEQDLMRLVSDRAKTATNR